MTERRKRVALLCAFALLLPIISIADDDFASPSSFDAAATLAVAIVIAIVFVAVSRIHSVTEPAYAIAFATPSDPRSPPR